MCINTPTHQKITNSIPHGLLGMPYLIAVHMAQTIAHVL